MMSLCRRALIASLLAALMVAAQLPADPAAAEPADREWCGEISRNTTFERLSSPHIITCDVQVSNSVLTIQPGAFVMFEAGTNLIIGPDSSLEAVGAENGKIRFRAVPDDVQPGFWGQIRFDSGANPSQMEFVDVQDGGQGGVPMVEVRDAVLVMGSQPAQNINVRFLNSGGAPLAITADDIGPSLGDAGRFAIGRVCSQVQFDASNVDNVVSIMAPGSPDVLETQTWHNFCVPYRTEDMVSVGGPTEPTLEIDAGTEIQFGPEAGLVVGIDADNRGQISTNGGVLLTGTEKSPGSWIGVDLTDHASNHSFSSVTVEYGGRGGRPMVRVGSNNAIAFGVVFRHALGYPLQLRVGGVESFMDGLTVSDDPVFVDNGVQRVLVVVDAVPGITRTTRWAGVGVPYELDDDLVVAGEGFGPELRLLDGAELAFRQGKALVIGTEDLLGNLQIDGVQGETVTLGGVESEPGSWLGLRMVNADSVNVGDAQFLNGGSDTEAMIEWQAAAGAITSTRMSGAAGYPLATEPQYIDNVFGEALARPNACPTSCALAVEGNGVDHLLVRGDIDIARGRVGWHDVGAPVELEGSITIERTGVTRLDLLDGAQLLFRPGQGIQAGGDPSQRAEVGFIDNDPARPVRVGAVSAEGWAGITVNPASRIFGQDAELSGASSDAAMITVAGGTVELTTVALTDSAGAGLAVTGDGAVARVSGATITGNRIGAVARNAGMLRISESTVSGNTEWGVLNEHEAFCVDAIRVFWGRQAGPMDESAADDNCIRAANQSPGADRVSDFVDWWPYATSTNGYPAAPGFGPNPKVIFLPRALNQN